MTQSHVDGRSSSAPSPIDVHVGGRIRLRRTLMGLSQEKLGEALGLTFQQVQKYERGANRVGASRLFDLSRILDVPIGFFFDGIEDRADHARAMGFAESQEAFGTPEAVMTFSTPSDDAAMFSKRETVDLVRAYYSIPDTAVRKRVLDLVRSMAPQPAAQ